MSIHDLALGYGCVAVLVAVAVLFYADRHWTVDPPRGAVRVVWIGLISALWPILVVGIGQLAVISMIARRIRPDGSAAEGEPAAVPVPH